MVEIFREAGLPDGVFNFIPGPGGEIGDYLVDHPDIATIAFTGSREIGLRIIGRAAAVHPGQRHVKRVIAEMGGKNAVIIDDDADLDEAVPARAEKRLRISGTKVQRLLARRRAGRRSRPVRAPIAGSGKRLENRPQRGSGQPHGCGHRRRGVGENPRIRQNRGKRGNPRVFVKSSRKRPLLRP